MKWICIDPGEETGWSVWNGDQLLTAGQAPLWQFIDDLDEGMTTERQDQYVYWGDVPVERFGAFVCEDWALYPWELQNLAWDKCRTARGIGAIELLARQYRVPIHLQGAKIKQAAKSLGAEELYLTPLHENRHANDSIQHGVYWLGVNEGKPPC